MTNNVNGKIYIGQTVRASAVRLSEHKRKTATILGKAIHKYGFENFTFEELDSVESIDRLNERERYWIAFYDCVIPKGYNQCEGGGNTSGFHHREESKHRMSAKKKAAYAGERNPFYGRTHTDGTKNKWSVQRKGRKLTDEWKTNIGLAGRKRVINLDSGEVFDSIMSAAEKYGLKDTHITRVCRGKRKTTGGFRWSYYSIL